MILELLYRGACFLCISNIIRIIATPLEEDERRAVGQGTGMERDGRKQLGPSVWLGKPMGTRDGTSRRITLSIHGCAIKMALVWSGVSGRAGKKAMLCTVLTSPRS